MRTPAGVECKFYYEDFNRGREIQRCRLIERDPRSEPWQPSICKTCPVPAILRANACPRMVLEARVSRRWLVVKQASVSAYCTFTNQEVADPMVGCGRCHEEGWQDIITGSDGG